MTQGDWIEAKNQAISVNRKTLERSHSLVATTADVFYGKRNQANSYLLYRLKLMFWCGGANMVNAH